MEKTTKISKLGLLALWSLLFGFAPFTLFSQALCPPNPDLVTSNPEFPGCQPPNALTFKVLLVLDESGSIIPLEADVEAAVQTFASTLHNNFTTPGKVSMGIVDFGNTASLGMGFTDVAPNSFIAGVNNYLLTGYTPFGSTNFVDALTLAQSTALANNVDIIFFVTDGFPNTAANTWRNIANKIKCDGTYIFGIAVGASASVANIQELSGPDMLGSPMSGSLLEGADYAQISFGNFGQLLVDLGNSLIDAQPPTVNCPVSVSAINNPGLCGAVVNFTTNVSDNCPNPSVTCVPPSGSFFNVGQSMVTCTASDNAGNQATCSFKVTVSDLEAPNIVCPPNKTVSCDDPMDPGALGNPVALDNCTVTSVLHGDARVDGTCANDYTLNRTWTAKDASGNIRTCLQVIKVEDKKPPVIVCPPNITVECDTAAAKTGVATATDNCLPRPTLSRSDAHISGDCEWLCVTERTWVAKDACLNTSRCIQRITKDVTPLIAQALAAGPLVLGQAGATVTVDQSHANCIVHWFPYNNVMTPKALPFDDAVAGAACTLMTNPLDASGHIENPLLGATMKLKLLVRLNPALGTRKLSTFTNCTMHFIIKQAMAPNADVNELLRVTDLTLGNVNVSLNVPAHALLLLNYIKCITGDLTVCKPN